MASRVAVATFLLGAWSVAAVGQILIDTDSGFFSDDGVAVTMLLRSARRSEVRGITTVSGNVWSQPGAGFMARNVKLLGLPNLPVLIGSESPLVHTQAMAGRERPLEFAGAFDTPTPVGPGTSPRGGVDFLIRSIEAASGKLTILAIGPLTNLAIALRLRPDLESKIGTLVMMGGAVHVPGNANKTAEFNFWFDPEAAQAVLRSAVRRKVLFALDICNQVKLTKATFDEIVRVKTPITELYREDFGNRYPGFLKNPKVEGSLWDELAAAYVIDPKVVTKSVKNYLDVETGFGAQYGSVKLLDRAIAPAATEVEVVLGMNFPRAIEIYKSALTTR